MSKATESKLSNLHGAVATALNEIISHKEDVTEFDDMGNETATGEKRHSAPPPMFAAAIKFLKDNNITCDIEQDENMSNLQEMLAKKQRHSRVSDAKKAALRVVGDE